MRSLAVYVLESTYPPAHRGSPPHGLVKVVRDEPLETTLNSTDTDSERRKNPYDGQTRQADRAICGGGFARSDGRWAGDGRGDASVSGAGRFGLERAIGKQ